MKYFVQSDIIYFENIFKLNNQDNIIIKQIQF